VTEDVARFRRIQLGVDRYGDGTEIGQREQQEHLGLAVGGHDGHPFASGDAASLE
jgi:hypothetical protein